MFIGSAETEQIRYELSDITGKIILAGNINAKQGSRQRIKTGGLNSGVYFVTFVNNNYRQVFKAAKVK